MKKKVRSCSTEGYIQEGLLALLPRYRGGFSETIVFTVKDKHLDPRGVPWLVEKLAVYYSMNLPELRRRCENILGIRHYISLPLSEGLVLLPVKVRQSDAAGETTTGFINLLQVKEILPPPPLPAESSSGRPTATRLHPGSPKKASPGPAWLSRIQFQCGLQLKTLNTPETLRGRLRQGDAVLQDFRRRRSQGNVFAGLSGEALLEQLPNCNCLLKNIFIKFLGLGIIMLLIVWNKDFSQLFSGMI